jgi:hypothetical protein
MVHERLILTAVGLFFLPWEASCGHQKVTTINDNRSLRCYERYIANDRQSTSDEHKRSSCNQPTRKPCRNKDDREWCKVCRRKKLRRFRRLAEGSDDHPGKKRVALWQGCQPSRIGEVLGVRTSRRAGRGGRSMQAIKISCWGRAMPCTSNAAKNALVLRLLAC